MVPSEPVFVPSVLVEGVLGLLEDAGVPEWINDSIVAVIEGWENEVIPTEKTADGGFLLIGHNEKGEVVVNLDRDRVGHVVFSPDQARQFANMLIRRANLIEDVR